MTHTNQELCVHVAVLGSGLRRTGIPRPPDPMIIGLSVTRPQLRRAKKCFGVSFPAIQENG